MCIFFAASYPGRTQGLILTGSYAKRLRSDDYPWAPTREERLAEIETTERTWPDTITLDKVAPSRATDEAFRGWMRRYARMSASPKAAAALLRMNSEIDVTSILPAIRVPSLLLYRQGDLDVSVEEGRFIASRIPGARLVELPGADHFFWAGDAEPLLAEIEEFVTGHRTAEEPDRVLATVLFTDIVSSTETASALGDRVWSDRLERHNVAVRAESLAWPSTPLATGSWPPSTVRPGPSAVPGGSWRPFGPSVWRCGPGSTPVKWRSWEGTWPAWRCTSPPASPPRRDRGRSWYLAR